MQPLHFLPLLKRIRWGGRRLGTVLGKQIGPETDYAESWEIADCGDSQSVVANGPYQGWTLQRLVREEPAALLGRQADLQQFPLLIKFLDAQDRLSVQVHPQHGKTEAWVILDAEPESKVFAGLKTGVDRATFERELEQGTVENCLHSFPAQVGDCIYIPAGTVHAIGEGILLAEIQQTSDITYRLYDWGRVGGDGKPRELHIAQSLECADFIGGPIQPQPVTAQHGTEELVASQFFHIRRHTLGRAIVLPATDHFRIISVIEGRAFLTSGDHAAPLKKGETVLLPATVEDATFTPEPEATLLESFVP